ncbi:hypothetical protein C8R43DRAFT_972783 [Mycena crocata]|nr:hypothetical protein C8R43DRAFT_972783 [Mycena crocata]
MPLLQPTVKPLPDSLSFAGKSALVTGANSGLGLAASLHFAQRHVSTLILAVRTQKAGETTKTALLADPVVRKLPNQPTILIYELELARPSSVAAFASKVLKEVPTLDILLLNAGIGAIEWKTTPENGNERMFQINFLSNAILSLQLLPLLRASAEKSGSTSHLTIVGSRAQDMHTFTKKPVPATVSVFAFLNDRANYSVARYGDSKALVSMWVEELARRTDASSVIVNNICPGMVVTNINDRQPLWLRILVSAVMSVRGRTTEVGGRTLVKAASAGPETHGKMIGDYEVWRVKFLETEAGRNMEKRVWKETLAAAEDLVPGSVERAELRD